MPEPKGIPLGQWLIENGYTLQDFPEIDPGFFLDPNYLIYDVDLSEYGPYTGLAIGPNFRNVKGNAQHIADKVGIPKGQRGMIIDSKAIQGYAQYGIDPRELTINRIKHEAHHSANDGTPAIIESLAYAFGDGQKVNGESVPFRLDQRWRETAHRLNDSRDLWETVPEPRLTSSTFYDPNQATNPLLESLQTRQEAPQRPRMGRLAPNSTPRLSGP